MILMFQSLHFALFLLMGATLLFHEKQSAVESLRVPSVKNQYVRVFDLSQQQIPYKTAYGWQEKLIEHHISLQTKQLLAKQEVSSVEDSNQNLIENERRCVGSLLCLQHLHVYTLGSAATEESGPFARCTPSGKPLNYETVKADRGGKVTYHGPGQFIFYPILDLVSVFV